jgi:hypothetical protein
LFRVELQQPIDEVLELKTQLFVDPNSSSLSRHYGLKETILFLDVFDVKRLEEVG